MAPSGSGAGDGYKHFYMDEKYTLAAFFSTVTAFLTGHLSLANIKKGEPNGRKIVDLAYGFFFIILFLMSILRFMSISTL
ncbi:hypothetical protein KBI33_01510 [Candidatus Shapirobacteria bacterium]|nr:hypothetical protein [Candidatus Shapirobacteria bacterium]